MPHKLFVRPEILEENEAPRLFQWGLYDAVGQKIRTGRHAGLEDIDQILMQNGVDEVDTVGLWPANRTFTGLVNLPGNQNRYLQQALPFAVEDQLAQDIDSVHISVGDKTRQSDYPVRVIDRELFQQYFDQLNEFCADQYHLKDIFLDADILPCADHDLVCWLDKESFLAMTQKGLAIGSRRENLIAYLDSIFLVPEGEERSGESFKLHIFCDENISEELSLLEGELAQYPGMALSIETVSLDEFDLLCTSYFHLPRLPVSLCQGAFKVVKKGGGAWQQWRYVAMIAGLGFLLQLGVFIAKGWYYQQEAAKIGELALSEYKKVVPQSSRVSIDKLPRIIKGKLNQRVQEGGAASDFLTLLGEAGYQFSRSSDKQQLEFNSITYNQRGELVMEMRAQSFEQLDRLKQAIVSSGLSAKISSAVQEDKYFRGRISVSGS